MVWYGLVRQTGGAKAIEACWRVYQHLQVCSILKPQNLEDGDLLHRDSLDMDGACVARLLCLVRHTAKQSYANVRVLRSPDGYGFARCISISEIGLYRLEQTRRAETQRQAAVHPTSF